MALYLELRHGRDSVDQDMTEAGFDGPVLGPLPYVHTTYGESIKVGDGIMLDVVGDCLAYGGKFYGDWTVITEEDLAAEGYTPVAPCEADAAVDPSCRTVDPRMLGIAPEMHKTLKSIESMCGSILRESYGNGPDYTTLERKLMWALSQIGDAAKQSIVLDRLADDPV